MSVPRTSVLRATRPGCPPPAHADHTPLDPELALSCAILRKAWHDARTGQGAVRRDARAFWHDPVQVAWWADLLGVPLQRYAALLRTAAPTASLPAQLSFSWEDVR